MSATDKLLGREPLWAGDAWLNMFVGPKLPPPWFYVGIGFGVLIGWVVF